jgi:hypothetical protein
MFGNRIYRCLLVFFPKPEKKNLDHADAAAGD